MNLYLQKSDFHVFEYTTWMIQAPDDVWHKVVSSFAETFASKISDGKLLLPDLIDWMMRESPSWVASIEVSPTSSAWSHWGQKLPFLLDSCQNIKQEDRQRQDQLASGAIQVQSLPGLSLGGDTSDEINPALFWLNPLMSQWSSLAPVQSSQRLWALVCTFYEHPSLRGSNRHLSPLSENLCWLEQAWTMQGWGAGPGHHEAHRWTRRFLDHPLWWSPVERPGQPGWVSWERLWEQIVRQAVTTCEGKIKVHTSTWKHLQDEKRRYSKQLGVETGVWFDKPKESYELFYISHWTQQQAWPKLYRDTIRALIKAMPEQDTYRMQYWKGSPNLVAKDDWFLEELDNGDALFDLWVSYGLTDWFKVWLEERVHQRKLETFETLTSNSSNQEKPWNEEQIQKELMSEMMARFKEQSTHHVAHPFDRCWINGHVQMADELLRLRWGPTQGQEGQHLRCVEAHGFHRLKHRRPHPIIHAPQSSDPSKVQEDHSFQCQEARTHRGVIEWRCSKNHLGHMRYFGFQMYSSSMFALSWRVLSPAMTLDDLSIDHFWHPAFKHPKDDRIQWLLTHETREAWEKAKLWSSVSSKGLHEKGNGHGIGDEGIWSRQECPGLVWLEASMQDVLRRPFEDLVKNHGQNSSQDIQDKDKPETVKNLAVYKDRQGPWFSPGQADESEFWFKFSNKSQASHLAKFKAWLQRKENDYYKGFCVSSSVQSHPLAVRYSPLSVCFLPFKILKSMSLKSSVPLMLVALGIGFGVVSPSVQAGTLNTNLDSSANVQNSCRIQSLDNIVFGMYDPLSAPI